MTSSIAFSMDMHGYWNVCCCTVMFTACGYSDTLHALTHDNSVKGYSQQYFLCQADNRLLCWSDTVLVPMYQMMLYFAQQLPHQRIISKYT